MKIIIIIINNYLAVMIFMTKSIKTKRFKRLTVTIRFIRTSLTLSNAIPILMKRRTIIDSVTR